MGAYIEAPQNWRRTMLEPPAVFLAGGITGCEDWQQDARRHLADHDVTVLNPRRADFDVTKGDSAAQQVRWEYEHLHRAEVTLFWFPACDPSVTVQPIALFELGSAIAEYEARGRRFVVGADPTYPRRLDIELQIENALGEWPIYERLMDTVAAAVWEAQR